MAASVNSAPTPTRPRVRNCRIPRCCFSTPIIGQPPFQFLDLHPCPRALVRIAGVARFLPAPDLPPDIRPLVPQALLRVNPIPRSVGSNARRVDGHQAQPSQTQLPRHLHHLREQVVQRPPVPPPERTQRPIVRPLSTRQITQPQVLPDALLQPPRTRDPQRIRVQPHLQHESRRIQLSALLAVRLLELGLSNRSPHPGTKKPRRSSP